MSTPAHAIVNLLLFRRDRALPVALGAIAPDLPLFLFYALEKLVLATPERLIWSASVLAPSWQSFFDTAHSFPLIGAGIGLASWRRSSALVSFLSSMALHSVGDFLLHHDDARRPSSRCRTGASKAPSRTGIPGTTEPSSGASKSS